MATRLLKTQLAYDELMIKESNSSPSWSWSQWEISGAVGGLRLKNFNGTGREVEAHGARAPLLSLFRREEPVDGGDSEPYTLHSYWSTSTPFIECARLRGLKSKDVLPQHFHDDQSWSSAQSQNVFPSFSGREPDGDEEMRAVSVLPGQRGEHGAQGTQLKWLNLQYNTSKLQ